MAGRVRSRWLALALTGAALLVSTACTRTFRASVLRPDPLAEPTATLRDSEKVTIVTGDMELNVPKQPGRAQRVSPMAMRRYPLKNTASFTVVSRDRLRFHVQLEHKWQEWADPSK